MTYVDFQKSHYILKHKDHNKKASYIFKLKSAEDKENDSSNNFSEKFFWKSPKKNPKIDLKVENNTEN